MGQKMPKTLRQKKMIKLKTVSHNIQEYHISTLYQNKKNMTTLCRCKFLCCFFHYAALRKHCDREFNTQWVVSLFGSVYHCFVYSQASRSNYCGYLHVLKYSLFITIILKQKEVIQTNTLADN